MIRKALLAMVFALLASLLGVAQGGPPFRTDDPGTPGNGNWEINVGVTTDRRAQERIFEAPILDINYGLGDRIQLKYELPFVVQGADASPTRSGLGNSLLGVKYRFFENKAHELQISTYPQFEFNNPTASADRGLVDRGVRMFLPVEVVKKVGPVHINGELGYWIAQYTRDQWASGLAVGHEWNRLELVGEIYATGKTDATYRETTFDGGGRIKLRDSVRLLLMAGRSFHGSASGEPQLIGYAGLQFLITKKKKDVQEAHN